MTTKLDYYSRLLATICTRRSEPFRRRLLDGFPAVRMTKGAKRKEQLQLLSVKLAARAGGGKVWLLHKQNHLLSLPVCARLQLLGRRPTVLRRYYATIVPDVQLARAHISGAPREALTMGAASPRRGRGERPARQSAPLTSLSRLRAGNPSAPGWILTLPVRRRAGGRATAA